MHLILIVLFLFLSVCLLVKACSGSDTQGGSGSGITPPQSDQTDTLPPELQGPQVVASASIGITGNIFPFDQLIEAGATGNTGYDFSDSLSFVSHSYAAYDFMIAGLETTLGGADAGKYGTSSAYNCPDEMIDAFKNAGVDLLLTSNDHAYDTGHDGFIRTQEILRSKGMLYTGSRLSEEEANYIVQDINGIKIGMICYTYESGDTAQGNKTINDNAIDKEDSTLINTFSYRRMDQFYSEIKAAKASMEEQGADFVMVFVHWGNEYDLAPSATQQKIAENLCEAGVDFIIGSHPHVVQPMQILTSKSGNVTYCLYSVGSAIGAERREKSKAMPNGHTEDGIIFGLEFQKLNNGNIIISNMNVTPLWTSLETAEHNILYTVLPVDVTYNFYPTLSDFADTVNGVIDPERPATQIGTVALSDPSQISASYTRTMDTILSSLNECRQKLGLAPVSNIPGN